MSSFLLFILVIWVEFSIVAGAYTVLRSGRLENFYIRIALWFFSPVLLISGVIFIKHCRKRLYFRNLISKLLTK
jgi:hypothetical protein